jgi:pyruvate carboxylase
MLIFLFSLNVVQSQQLGLGTQWEAVKKAYIEANQLVSTRFDVNCHGLADVWLFF